MVMITTVLAMIFFGLFIVQNRSVLNRCPTVLRYDRHADSNPYRSASIELPREFPGWAIITGRPENMVLPAVRCRKVRVLPFSPPLSPGSREPLYLSRNVVDRGDNGRAN